MILEDKLKEIRALRHIVEGASMITEKYAHDGDLDMDILYKYLNIAHVTASKIIEKLLLDISLREE